MNAALLPSGDRPPVPPLRHRLLLFGLVALVVFLGYLPTVAREIAVGDGGELITAARTLGIAHPPGYPLWSLLAHALARLAPVESFAFGANVASALFGSLTAATASLAALRIGAGLAGATAAGLLTGFSRALWSQSASAEVYSLNALLFVAMVLFALSPPSRKSAAAFGLLAGLSLTMHPVMRGLVPIAALWYLADRWRSRALRSEGGVAAASFVAGLAVFLYLPLRAAARPYLNWENPVDLRGIARLLGMTVYRSPEENVLLQHPIFLGFLPRLRTFLEILLLQFPPPALLLSAFGALLAIRRRPLAGLALLALAGAASVGLVLTTSRLDARVYPPAYHTFSIPAFVVAGIWIGPALEWILGAARRLGPHSWNRRGALPAAVLGVSLLLAGWSYAIHRRGNDRSADALAADFGRNLLETPEPGAILLVWGDTALIPCLYQQGVVGLRPDVEIGSKYGRVDPALLRRYGASLEGPATEMERIAAAAADLRPIYTNVPHRFPADPGLVCVPVGLLDRIVREGSEEERRARERSGSVWAAYRWRTLGKERGNRPVREIEAFIRERAAARFVDAGDMAGAIEEWRKLAELRPEDAVLLSNLGTALVNAGRTEEGIRFLRESLARGPNDPETRASLGRALHASGASKEAVQVLLPLLERPPVDLEPYLFLAEAALSLGDASTALRALETGRVRFPSDPRPFAAAARILLKDLRDPDAALPLAETALRLSPGNAEAEALLAEIRAAPR